uniref:Cell wall anchored protein n=1 Tax=Bionectria ochroleuca TaxID=29856 RepID=A0A8H7NB87_BIOOC
MDWLPKPHSWARLFLFLSFTGLSTQQRDPIINFCRRWGHQAAIVDSKLYYDGGLVTYNGDNSHENLTNPFLLYHDLSAVDPSGMPPPYANLSKNSTIPNVNGGIFWPDTVNKRIYLYGGQFYNEKPWSTNNLYSYDVIYNNWQLTSSPRTNGIARLAYGAGVSVPERGKAYYYGGWMNNYTDPNWTGPGAMTSYLLEYSMDDDTWTNSTGPDNIGRAEGVMLSIPAGDGGLLIYFGGVASNNLGAPRSQPMEQIIVYDPVSSKSYMENATGDIPPNRRRFCAGATWADDRSAYNIYLYGGLPGQPGDGPGFDDIYVLSVPSFTWTRFYPPDGSNGTVPHWGLTCNVVGRGQMIVQGGFFPLDDKCDSPAVWGLHNMDLGRQNNESAIWALFDPKKTNYVIPSPLATVIGAQATGKATVTAPKSGWENQDLQVLMTRTASYATRTPTRAIPTSTGSSSDDDHKSGLSAGAIAGIAVGSVVGAAIIIGLIWFFLFRRFLARKREREQQQQQQQQQPQEQRPEVSQMSAGNSYYNSQSYPNSNWAYSPGSHASTSSPPPFASLSPHYGHQSPVTELPVEYPPSKFAGYGSQYTAHEAPTPERTPDQR